MSVFSPQAWFESGYEKVMGTPASSFRFIPGETPISTFREVFAFIVTYLIVIFGGQRLMKNQKPIKLSLLFQIHNMFLTILSLGLLVLIVENSFPMLYRDGFYNAVCSPKSFTQPLELLYYINYLTKYYELLDTVFLVLRKKNLQFLHWYHHSMTALLCFTQINGHTIMSWVPATLNLAVHVLMYYYYFLATFDIKVWWKKYITICQIIQFVIDIAVISFCVVNWVGYNVMPSLPHFGNCPSDVFVGFFGSFMMISYLYLFLDFFTRVYTKPVRTLNSKYTKKTEFSEKSSSNLLKDKKPDSIQEEFQK